MRPSFHKQYRPLTSRPFLSGSSYSEYPPCSQLAPYIACFWETGGESGIGEAMSREVLVIPDTCADIIIEIDHTAGTITSRLCGLADSPKLIEQKPVRENVTTFAVRFYFWAMRLFLDVEMRELYNQTFDFALVDQMAFREYEALFYMADTSERIAWMESHLIKKLLRITANSCYNSNLYNSIEKILYGRGNISVKEICKYSCVSQRQMERLFLQNIGMSIKRTAGLIRYQNVWCDVVKQERFDVQDAVYRYGFSDQSHLLNQFKRFHGVTPEQAKQIALINR